MHFAFTEEQAMIADMARGFFAREATSQRTRAAMATAEGVDRLLWRDFSRDLGLAGIALPAEYGGAALGAVGMAIVAEAAGAQVAALPFLTCCIAAQALLAGGTAAQQQRWLPALAAGEIIAAYGAAKGEMRNGRFSGVAPLVPHGAAADLLVLQVDGAALLVARGDGVRIAPQISMDQTRPLARILLDGAVAEPLGAAAVPEAWQTGAVAIAADALGGAQACLDLTVAHVRERVQFGRPIGSFQAVKHRLADMLIDIEQTRSALWWAASAVDEEGMDAALAPHAAKAFACDTYVHCAAELIQLHGGIGFTWEHDAHLHFKRARADLTWLGTPEWHRERIAALLPLDAAA